MNKRINVEFETLEKAKSQLKLRIMRQRILPTKDGLKDIQYLQRKITRMRANKFK